MVEPYVVRGHALDTQQMEAVVDQSDTELVIAGAGTGKTTTLIGKVRHLIEYEKVDPHRILMISLTNNSVNDLRRVVSEEFGEGFGADIMTIHSLGNGIIRKRPCVGSNRCNILRIIINDLVQIDRRSANALVQYVDGMRSTGSADISYSGVQIPQPGLRSVSDALFQCNFKTEYVRADRKGDDSVPAYLVLDDGRGRRFRLYADDERVKDIVRNPVKVWQFLRDCGFPTDRMNPNDLASNILMAWGDRIPESIGAFIGRCKCTRTSISDLRAAITATDDFVKVRIEDKLYLIDGVWDQYSMLFSQGDMVDFEDMVTVATDMVDMGCCLGRRYDHVLIDEYQDVSRTLVDLVKSLRRRMGFKLFCVGDDWQSIYSFSGGDVWETFGFEDVWRSFGDVSVHRIERTYRCPQALVEMTNGFVSKNPMQLRKSIKGHNRNTSPPVQLLPTEKDWDIARVIANRIEHLDPRESVLVIGRTRNDINALTAPSFVKGQDERPSGSVDVMFRVWDEYIEDMRDDRTITFMTAHSSKGLEADNVFIIADRDRGGFPSTVNDELSDLFATRDEGIPLPEERRVLYVAMTRARKRLFIINRMEDGYVFSSTTPMIQELITDNIRLLSRSTPVCRECAGPMKIVRYKGKCFYGCLDRDCRGGSRPFEGL